MVEVTWFFSLNIISILNFMNEKKLAQTRSKEWKSIRFLNTSYHMEIITGDMLLDISRCTYVHDTN